MQCSAAAAVAGTSVASFSVAPASETPAKTAHFSCADATGEGVGDGDGGVCVGVDVGNSIGKLLPPPPPPQATSRLMDSAQVVIERGFFMICLLFVLPHKLGRPRHVACAAHARQ